MQANATTISELAGQAYGWFEKRERPDGENYVTLKDGAPEWVHDLVHDAHGDFLPDDWRYRAIRSALGEIHDNGDAEDLDDLGHQWADDNVDTYTGRRVEWLASNLNRAGYCDSGADELGLPEGGIVNLIGVGQYMESREVFESVAESLRTLVGDDD